ncbi:MAG TPA: hypothetical protein VL588_13180 [Bdellovibrionota bacterium]|nr:hypothetical protein [Bdellovibrionota bacterium]
MEEFRNSRPLFALVSALILACGALVSGCTAQAERQNVVLSGDLTLSVRQGGRVVALKSFKIADLLARKQVRVAGHGPGSSDSHEWSGVPITELINGVLAESPQARAFEIDLLVLKTADGAKSILPRSFINKYPVILALKKEGSALSKISTVVRNPESSDIRREMLPVDSYFVSGLVEIEMANYREQFPSVFLKNRSDPRRMRGERLFVKTCMGCHGRSEWPMGDALSRKLLGRGRDLPLHPGVEGMPSLAEPDHAGLKSYFEAVRLENPDIAGAVARANGKS